MINQPTVQRFLKVCKNYLSAEQYELLCLAYGDVVTMKTSVAVPEAKPLRAAAKGMFATSNKNIAKILYEEGLTNSPYYEPSWL